MMDRLQEHKSTGSQALRDFLCSCAPVLLCSLSLFGCATTSNRPIKSSEPVETTSEQLEAAQKVVGAMGNKEVSREDLKALATDMQRDQASRSAVQKIIGVTDEKPVIKYSPATGKHYSGDLEYDPETGVKLKVLQE
jgi:hypothetical protein